MRPQPLVQPTALKSFLEDQMLVPGDRADRFDQGLAVRLDWKVLQALPGLGPHRHRRQESRAQSERSPSQDQISRRKGSGA